MVLIPVPPPANEPPSISALKGRGRPIQPQTAPRARPGTKVAQQRWCAKVALMLKQRAGQEFLIRRYKSPTGAWTARGRWAPLMKGVEWRACKEETPEGHTSALYAWWPVKEPKLRADRWR